MNNSEQIKKIEYPEIVCIGDSLYYKTDEICERVPRRMPDGLIKSFYPVEIMPDAHESANFGAEYECLEYMFTEDTEVIVHLGKEWFYCENGDDCIE